MVTGIYGKPLAKQFGAPCAWQCLGNTALNQSNPSLVLNLRQASTTFWEQIQSAEYGFWANVNPEVSHPRWSQASERILGTNKRVPTLPYNGYGEQVAAMYSDIKGENLFR